MPPPAQQKNTSNPPTAIRIGNKLERVFRFVDVGVGVAWAVGSSTRYTTAVGALGAGILTMQPQLGHLACTPARWSKTCDVCRHSGQVNGKGTAALRDASLRGLFHYHTVIRRQTPSVIRKLDFFPCENCVPCRLARIPSSWPARRPDGSVPAPAS